jgi:riboflavin biosynthesis pyrimidine reductase
MIASIDGHATVDGRAGGLGNPADRALLRELRTAADVVLVGRNTLTTERYATLLDPDQCAYRVAQGRTAQPTVATITRRPQLLADVPLLAEPDVPVVIYCAPKPDDPPAGADLRALDPLTVPAVIADLHTSIGASLIVCEGGPRLLRDLVAEEVLDDLVLTVAPVLVAGPGPSLLTGDVLDPAPSLRLAHSARAGDYLMLHYTR